MKKTEIRKLIEAVVKHWTDMFKKPEYSDRSNGGQLGGFESMLMTYAKLAVNTQNDVNDTKIAKFADAMKKYIEDKYVKKLQCNFQTDWFPEYPLSDFLAESGLPGTFFPSKYDMYIDFEKGTVHAGGIGQCKQIYPIAS